MPEPVLSFTVQYAVEAPELSRQQLRAWALKAVQAAWADDPEAFQRAELNLRLVDTEEGRALNASYRDKDYATNVLTFEYGVDPEGTAHGDIILCLDVLKKEATEQGKPFKNHAAHLVVHGTLHALGYDHIDNEEAEHMENLEIAILARLHIENPYLERG
ncbi:rRNA maturation RNase YbeY [Advenella sp. RU8]|uniref:rRNA maturation RNase YbeY n=1 Tax=Advenella sp. RU8 TaxID=3399575 RepID=UPI003AAC3063